MPTETDQPTPPAQAPAEATERAEEAEMKSSYSYGNGASVDVALCACNGCTAAPIIVTLRCARTYPTEAEIASVLTEFETWSDLLTAGFPAFEVPAGEPPADHRTATEREAAQRRAMLDLVGEQGAFFPADDYEPITTTLKELVEYAEQQEELTARFVAHGKKRRDYIDSLIEAADNDLSMTWQDAHNRLDGDDDIPGQVAS